MTESVLNAAALSIGKNVRSDDEEYVRYVSWRIDFPANSRGAKNTRIWKPRLIAGLGVAENRGVDARAIDP